MQLFAYLQAAEHPVPRGVHRIRRAEQCRGQEAGPGGLVPRQRRFQGARLMQQLPGLPGQVPCRFLSDADPDPSDRYVLGPLGSGSVSYRYESGPFYHQAKIVRKTLIPTVL